MVGIWNEGDRLYQREISEGHSSHIGAYGSGIDTKMAKKDTILRLECSHFLSQHGCNEGEDKAVRKLCIKPHNSAVRRWMPFQSQRTG